MASRVWVLPLVVALVETSPLPRQEGPSSACRPLKDATPSGGSRGIVQVEAHRPNGIRVRLGRLGCSLWNRISALDSVSMVDGPFFDLWVTGADQRLRILDAAGQELFSASSEHPSLIVQRIASEADIRRLSGISKSLDGLHLDLFALDHAVDGEVAEGAVVDLRVRAAPGTRLMILYVDPRGAISVLDDSRVVSALPDRSSYEATLAALTIPFVPGRAFFMAFALDDDFWRDDSENWEVWPLTPEFEMLLERLESGATDVVRKEVQVRHVPEKD